MSIRRAWVLGLTVPLSLWACSHGVGEEDEGEEKGEWAIADAALEECVRTALGGHAGDLLEGDVEWIERLSCPDRGIQSLDGIEALASLRALSLWENEITDLAPLSGLRALTELQLGHNRIEDVAPLASLTSLSRLGLADNAIQDVAALADLSQLTWLALDHNRLTDSDIGSLCGLDLAWLTAAHNAVSDDGVFACFDGDVYADFQRSEVHRSRTPDALPPVSSVGVDSSKAATLRGSMTAAGLELVADVDGLALPTVAALPGALAARDGEVTLSRGGVETSVGELVAGEVVLCEGAFADTCSLDVAVKTGARAPDVPKATAVVTVRLSLRDDQQLTPRGLPSDGGRNEELLPYVLASPNQFDAGSCLFMATTGAMELLTNQHTPMERIAYKGDTDFSERSLMNASSYVGPSDIRHTLTDLAYTYNVQGGSLLDRDYPFVAGYVQETATGDVSAADPSDDGAFLSCYYNWLDELPEGWEGMLTDTPEVARSIIHVDPARTENSRWNVGLMDREVIERIKYELDTKKAPVIVVYNHYLYWHANIIVGYDDSVETGQCPMVRSTLGYFAQEGAQSYVSKIESHMEAQGGCVDRGVFYVRDSIYEGGAEEESYIYSDRYNLSDKYSKRIVELSYDWVVYLANHAYSMHRRSEP
jgi:hypothetical protein